MAVELLALYEWLVEVGLFSITRTMGAESLTMSEGL